MLTSESSTDETWDFGKELAVLRARGTLKEAEEARKAEGNISSDRVGMSQGFFGPPNGVQINI